MQHDSLKCWIEACKLEEGIKEAEGTKDKTSGNLD